MFKMTKAKKETKKTEKKAKAAAKPKKEAKAAKPKAEKAARPAKLKLEKIEKPAKEEKAEITSASETSDRKTKLIIFDFWGTLIENGVFPSPIRQAYKMLRIRTTFPEYIVPFEETLMLRKYKDLYDAFMYVFDRLRVRPPRFVLDNLVGLWNKNKLLARPYPETFEVLEELRKGYKLALISNTDCFTLKEVMEKYGIDKYFDVISLSYEKGMLKSNPQMFKEILDKLGVDESETVMVGDSVESDIAAAEKAGIRGILIDRRERREFSPKIKSLHELKDFL